MSLHPLPRRAGIARENLTFKSLPVVIALSLGALVVVKQEFVFSSPGLSLSEAEAALRLSGAMRYFRSLWIEACGL